MRFEQAFDRVIGHEGGYVNHPDDPGGETKWGISKRAYPNVSIKDLTREQARDLYLADYWSPLHLEGLPDEIQFNVFDAAVNHGRGNAVRLLQRAIGVADDGHMGKITLGVLDTFPEAVFVARFNAERILFWSKLSTWSTFGKGWARRAAANLLELKP